MFEEIVKHYPDFPKKGIDFIDVVPFLQDVDTFKKIVADIDRYCATPNVATVEARGFLFASPLLAVSDHVKNLIPVRKKGKLPYREGDLQAVAVEKEYGSDQVYYRRSDIAAGIAEGGVFHITLFDDLLATGGTAYGIANSLNNEQLIIDGQSYKVQIDSFVFLVELPALGGKKNLEKIAPVHSIVKIEGVE